MRKLQRGRKKKFRILLDSAFARAGAFPHLQKKANLIHPVHDLNLSPQTEDKQLYQVAIQDNRFILTINFKDFKKLVKSGKPGIIGIESQLTNKQIDQKVTVFISNKNPEDYRGKAVTILSFIG